MVDTIADMERRQEPVKIAKPLMWRRLGVFSKITVILACGLCVDVRQNKI